MNVYATESIRNVVLLGHGGCGKTSLIESMAFTTGIIKRVRTCLLYTSTHIYVIRLSFCKKDVLYSTTYQAQVGKISKSFFISFL